MYTRFFGLNEKPFSITPDPRYLFMSERHTEALAHLIYGVRESGGFIQLTGEVGTGKTTLVRSLLQQVPDNADVAVILNPQISRNEFLSAICEELGVALPQTANSIKTLTNALNEYLLDNYSQGKRTILIVDEAQNLRVEVLEQVRLLTNLETTKQKLLQIILIGQPELRDVLSRNDMRQLAQRITGRYHLEPLSREETLTYIDHRLKVAGAVGQIFSPKAKRELFRLSQGVPRMINVIADRAMLGAFTQDYREITPELLRQAASEVFDKNHHLLSPWMPRLRIAALAAAVCVLATLLVIAVTGNDGGQNAVADAPALQPAAGYAQSSDARPETGVITAGEPVRTNPVINDILTRHQGQTSTDKAFETLFSLWSLDYTRGPMRACQQAQQQGLVCLFQRGSLNQVRSLNRPVILTLRDSDGNQHQVVLAELDGEQAWIAIADQRYEVNAAELSQFWFGDYLLIWRPQIEGPKQFVPGMRDDDVRWLRASLARIQGQPVPPMDSDLFDQDLEDRVKSYQRERRLTVDGLVGYQTQIAINTDLKESGSPQLVQAN